MKKLETPRALSLLAIAGAEAFMTDRFMKLNFGSSSLEVGGFE
ncbi:MAG: hypothetical protein WBP93_18110 [Pyrinomonadaceae bacterium]